MIHFQLSFELDAKSQFQKGTHKAVLAGQLSIRAPKGLGLDRGPGDMVGPCKSSPISSWSDSTGAAHEEDISQGRKTRTVSPCLLIQPKSEAAPAISLYCQGASICIMSQMALFSTVRRQIPYKKRRSKTWSVLKTTVTPKDKELTSVEKVWK